MTMLRAEVTEYVFNIHEDKLLNLNCPIDKIEVSVDNGRFHMSVNGSVVYRSSSFNDGSVTVQVS